MIMGRIAVRPGQPGRNGHAWAASRAGPRCAGTTRTERARATRSAGLLPSAMRRGGTPGGRSRARATLPSIERATWRRTSSRGAPLALAQLDQLDEPAPDRLPDRRVGGRGRVRLDLEEDLVRALVEQHLVGAVERLLHVVVVGEVGARLLERFLDPLGRPVVAGEEEGALVGEQRVHVRLRDPGPGGDVRGAGAVVAALRELDDRRLKQVRPALLRAQPPRALGLSRAAAGVRFWVGCRIVPA